MTKEKKEKTFPTYEYEDKLRSEGYVYIAGTDEAGRGPLAGPVFAAAVILPPGLDIPGLNDSKKITDKKRRELFSVIEEKAVSFAIASADEREIDEINILNASQLAMRRSVSMLFPKAEYVLIDGNVSRGFDIPTMTLIKGDSKSMSIAAASILAKVARDDYMLQVHEEYPVYGFDKHKGYPTKAHMDAVREYGPCPYHRVSFLSFLDKEK